jgi:uroporphyrinogen decarboxylase
MNHIERVVASLQNEPVDRLTTYPIACGVNRSLLGNVTYHEWASDPKKFADAFIAGQKYFDFDFAIGLMDLSVMAGDLGAHVRMDEENTPFVDEPVIKTVEDYEKLEVPDVTKGRSYVLNEGTKLFAEALGSEVITAGFLEGPLLVLTQCAGAERVFMDMYNNPSAIHTALKTITEYDSEMIKGMAETKVAGIVWDYLWGSYSCLGDNEYDEFEGGKYAARLNKETVDAGKALCIHNCADLPHLDTQIGKMKPVIYSMAYYPLIPGSPSAKDTIEKGYADNCLIAGNIDPQLFIRGSNEKISKVTNDLLQEVKVALCERGLNSKYCTASGCEVPPSIHTKMENIKSVIDLTKKNGQVACG